MALTILNPNICAHIVDTLSIEPSDYRTFRLSNIGLSSSRHCI